MGYPRRMPSVLNSYEQLALLKQPNPKAPTGMRNLCILTLMLKIGLRVNEVINLQGNDIDWNQGKINIKESGAAKGRTLWVDEPEIALLNRWRSIKPENSSFFFSTLDGNKIKDRYIREMVKRLARKAGISKDVYPHLLRYTFAVEFMRETKDINLLQDALGHRDTSATQIYAKLMFEDLREPCFSDKHNKRSGMPAPEDEQRRFSVIEKSGSDEIEQDIDTRQSTAEIIPEEPDRVVKESNQSVAKSPDRAVDAIIENDIPKEKEYVPVIKEKNKPDITMETVPMKEEKAKPEKEELEEQGKSEETLYKKYEEEIEMRIQLEAEKFTNSKVPIPAIKCSQCNYILRFQGDCPKCGASFNAILKHWGKNV
ncbi:MAG: tyrosine-type recombinase/integrase [Bacillota bacterium]